VHPRQFAGVGGGGVGVVRRDARPSHVRCGILRRRDNVAGVGPLHAHVHPVERHVIVAATQVIRGMICPRGSGSRRAAPVRYPAMRCASVERPHAVQASHALAGSMPG